MGKSSRLMRIPVELSDVIEKMSEELNVLPHTLRNTAILYGLYVIAITKKIPKSDDEFQDLFNKLKRLVGYGEKER
jgi:hypothetical protein